MAWIGLFAAAVSGLVHVMAIQPSIVASTLADIRDRCTEQLAIEQNGKDCDGPSPVLPLSRLIDEYLAAQPAALVTSTLVAAATAAHAASCPQPLPVDDEADWFFDDLAEADQPVAAAPSPPAALAAPGSDSLLGFLASLGSGLSHGQGESMDAAVRVVHRLLCAQGITDAVQLRRALADSNRIDLTEQWDLSSMVTLQARLGPTRSPASASVAAPSAEPKSPHCELVEGVLLDLFSQEVASVRNILLRAQPAAATTANTAHPSAQQSSSVDDAVDVGVVLVLGDVSAPESSAVISVAPPSAGSSAGDSVRAAMALNERRKDAYLTQLHQRLHSLRVGLVLCKGSFDKNVQAHLQARGVVCLETVNLPRLEAVSRVAVAPMVSELADVADAHVGRARIALRSLGWNPSLVHQNVVRDMDREADSVAASLRSEMKLVLTPELHPLSGPFPPPSLSPSIPAHLRLLTTHATAIDARRFATSFWNCTHRLRHALRDRCVCRGGGAVERVWIAAIERGAQRIRDEIAQHLDASAAPSPSVDADADADGALEVRCQSLAVHEAIADAFRHYLQLLLTNADAGTDEQRWVEVHGPTLSLEALDEDGNALYDTRSCSLSALSTCVYLFQLFLHVDATMSCANGRTLFQLMEGRMDKQGRSVRVL